MASRRKARILAFQAIYAWDASSVGYDELLSFSWLGEDSLASSDEELKAFAGLIVSGTIENVEAVDAAIKRHLEHWAFERLKRVDLAILRVSVYSLVYQRDIPAQITIDEAIEIAKEFGSEDSYRFINGVLDAVWKERGAEA
ncbi:MAG TPA: transcription antitermination factor NusB [Spirochaetales bacterium]|nr:transcription antitermination factor NusB [Spirochaetales bacterium]HPB66151.1 transcription antitermination factor NusB [Spirochaetales bacterium]HPG86091.1 transcription antitermination factor NusB [Spirochaetales bacterium]HPM72826.1 transcription antitermination factor NusB [Spirochaetales bacterium]